MDRVATFKSRCPPWRGRRPPTDARGFRQRGLDALPALTKELAHGIRQRGGIVGDVLAQHGIRFLFALCGGHIAPILVGSKARGIRVVDVRDEVSAVFAADAVARMTGTPGVAAVTAGPGVTNSMTAVKNAQLAQTPLVVLGGATATLLKGRGSLQDIDQLALMRPATKWATSVRTLKELRPTLERALDTACEGVPGPVFVEVPIDVLYPETTVREVFLREIGAHNGRGVGAKVLELLVRAYLFRQFHAPRIRVPFSTASFRSLQGGGESARVARAVEVVARARRPVLVIGSQALVACRDADGLRRAVERLGLPTYLAGSARGLLGRSHPIQLRHARSKALADADVVVVAGFPFDSRLGYGRSIGPNATVVAANLSAVELTKNRAADVGIQMHPRDFLLKLSSATGGPGPWGDWFEVLGRREAAREEQIAQQAAHEDGLVNPLLLLSRLEAKLGDDAVLVVDGGDFVATAAYVLRPRAPLSWLDPGVFGTLGVGGGFAVGAAVCRPGAEVWLIYGDGSCAYSLAEIDTCVRHGLAPIALIGTDASWAQIAREQGPLLGDDIGTVLLRTDYHRVAEGYGAVGILLDDPARIDDALEEAKRHAREGRPVVINAHIARSDFRKGSISM